MVVVGAHVTSSPLRDSPFKIRFLYPTGGFTSEQPFPFSLSPLAPKMKSRNDKLLSLQQPQRAAKSDGDDGGESNIPPPHNSKYYYYYPQSKQKQRLAQ
jgi:hypothetical protein